MNKKAERILRKYKNKRAGIFIDDANMFHSQRRVGWFIDWRKFKKFLEENFKVQFIRYYRGVYSKNEKIPKKIRENHQRYGQILKRIGFEIVIRSLKKIYIDKRKTKFLYKCDFDAEIGFDIATYLKKINLIILVSGDSDFASLSDKLREKRKNFLIVCFRFNAPWEFYRLSHIFFEELEEVRLDKNKKTPLAG